MNSRLSLLLAALAAFAPVISHGITLPVSEDAYTSVVKKTNDPRVTSASGAAATLRLAVPYSPVIRFEAGSLAADYPSAEVSRALLMVYFTKVTKPGDIAVHTVAHDWTEAPGNTPGLVAFQPVPPIATIPASSVIAKQFAIIDVTAQVKSWLDNPATDFGFGFLVDGVTSVELGAKEGPSSGYPAILQIERTPVIGNADLPSAIDATKLGTGSITNTEFSYLDGVTSGLQPQLDGLTNAVETNRLTSVGKVSKAGDTMTGPLNLPANGLKVGVGQLSLLSDKVGINTGTSVPTAALEVRGDIKLGTDGNLKATAGEENLRIIRGAILSQGGSLSVVRGQGFTFSASGSDSIITFNTPFSEPPVITVSQEKSSVDTAGNIEIFTRNVTTTGAIIQTNTGVSGITFHFTAIGLR